MGQWEKKIDTLYWEIGRYSFPIELANRSVPKTKAKIGRNSGKLLSFIRILKRKRRKTGKIKSSSGNIVKAIGRGPPEGWELRIAEWNGLEPTLLNKSNGKNGGFGINHIVYSIFLILILLFSFTGCKKASEPEDNTPKTQEYCITLVDTFTKNPLTDFRVAMVRNDTELSNGKTDSSGKVCFVVDTGVYDIYSNINISKNVLNKEYFGSIMKLDSYDTSHIDVKIDIPKKDDIFDPKFPVHGGCVAYFYYDNGKWMISGIRKRLKPKVYPDKSVFNYPNIKQVLTVDLKRLTQGKLDYTVDEFEVSDNEKAEDNVFKFVLSDYGSAAHFMNNYEITGAYSRAPPGLINKIRREVFKSIVGGDDTDVPIGYDSIMGHINGFTQRDIRVLHYKMDLRNPDDYIVENNEHPYEVRTLPKNTYSESQTSVMVYGGWVEVVEPSGFYMRKRYIMIPPPSPEAIVGKNSGVYINGENCRYGACTVSTGDNPYPPSPFKNTKHLINKLKKR